MDYFPYVRIRRRMKQCRHVNGVKRYHQIELTIPARFRDLVKPFMNRDLELDIKRKDDRIIIEAKMVDLWLSPLRPEASC